ncbi:GNAT family N-acetyltransferase [Geomicrobium sp. JCM 19037]|uniref:GNAT family N-acetyltransferase n=1 Tax=Geomicrobium sp. JCM 19037 TaxID=1460634 RepID=UPI0026D672FB|nr:GNAT family N-acetyltransferase [Geomicrobium sp. JCM 19037]
MEIKRQERKHVIENTDGEMLAEITFVPSGSSMVIIDHTYVSDEMRGKGTASKLVASVVDEMRQQGRRSCHYVRLLKQSLNDTQNTKMCYTKKIKFRESNHVNYSIGCTL